jgi:hypothetical protein
MPELHATWPWLTLVALGAFHGINPAMGWLFAVALGLQERRWQAVPAALGAIALGHALAIGLVVLVVGVLGLIIPQQLLLALGGAALLGFAAFKVASRFRHPRWVGLRVGPRALVGWSALMASAHGAGLMLVPVLVQWRGEGVSSALAQAGHAGHAAHTPTAAEATIGSALLAVGVHTTAMLAVAGLAAFLVYRFVGVEILRRAWINLDLLWVGALALTGGIAVMFGLWPLLSA